MAKRKIDNNVGFNMDTKNIPVTAETIKEIEKNIRKLVNNCCPTLSDHVGNSTFMIKPSCLIYDADRDGFMEKTETVMGHGIYKDIKKEILVTLERSDLKGIPRWFLGGKYNAMAIALVQAKYKYPNRLMIIKSVGGLRTCLVVAYITNKDHFIAFDPHNCPAHFDIMIKGDIL